jgi:fucose permease
MLMLGRFSGAFIQARVRPERMLAWYGAANVVLCLVAALASGWLAVGSLWMTSFFMSIMFPTIFALGVRDLQEDTELGASFLIMSIIGGALIAPLTGLLSEHLGGIHLAMSIPALCFLVCTGFALALGFGIALAAAALQFPLGHPSVASVIPGLVSAAQIAQTRALYATPIPVEFWSALKSQGLLRPDAPCPGAAVGA